MDLGNNSVGVRGSDHHRGLLLLLLHEQAQEGEEHDTEEGTGSRRAGSHQN